MSFLDSTKAAFAEMYDALLRDVVGETGSIKLYDEDGATIATITSGWFADEKSEEQSFERINELHITDRTGIAFDDAVAFGFGGYRYERVRFPNPPVNNPREWTWLIKPVGLDATGDFVIDDGGNFLVDDAGDSIVWV